MTEQEIKQRVKERDGYRCQECGITSAEHRKVYRQKLGLEVHRIIPGSEYLEDWCVTLCKRCHARKPKRALSVFNGDDPNIRVFWFNLYREEDRRVMECLEAIAAARNGTVAEVIDKAIAAAIGDLVTDYSI